MNKKKLFDLLYFVMIVSLIIFMIWIVGFMKSNAKECLKDPVAYFEAKNDGAVCYCYKQGFGQGNAITPVLELEEGVWNNQP